MIEINVIDRGRISYKKAWDFQTEIHEGMKELKISNRGKDASDKIKQQHSFILCEHNPVYTLGKSGSEDHLLIDENKRAKEKIEYFKINRGGDITFHGPGQIVGYPILDMDEIFTDIHKYVRYLEEVIIRTCADYGVKCERIEGYTGVWINDDKSKRKICAIGVHLSRWVTMHGFAFNVNTDLDYFKFIVPCGIQEEGKEVTSLSKELGRELDYEEVKSKVLDHFEELFQVKLNRI